MKAVNTVAKQSTVTQQQAISVERSGTSLTALLDAVYSLFNRITLRFSPKAVDRQQKKSRRAAGKAVRRKRTNKGAVKQQ